MKPISVRPGEAFSMNADAAGTLSPDSEPNHVSFQGMREHAPPNTPAPECIYIDLPASSAANLAACSETGEPLPPTAPTSGKTRAQVRAELAEAKAAGLVTYGEDEYPVAIPTPGPGKTRAQVRAELAEAKAAGLVTYGENEYPVTPTAPTPAKPHEPARGSFLDRLPGPLKRLWSDID